MSVATDNANLVEIWKMIVEVLICKRFVKQ